MHYDVTQTQYQQLMTMNPSEFKDPQNPVENLSWNDAVEFCKRLSELNEEKSANRMYRLPTEAEWEYSCRAGSDAVYCFGNDHSKMVQFAWTGQNSSGTTHPVGQKSANSWGLFYMHGNVFEWCSDLRGDYGSEAVVDPAGATSGAERISRGGSWFHAPIHCRAATRVWNPPANFSNCQGFRVVMEVVGK